MHGVIAARRRWRLPTPRCQLPARAAATVYEPSAAATTRKPTLAMAASACRGRPIKHLLSIPPSVPDPIPSPVIKSPGSSSSSLALEPPPSPVHLSRPVASGTKITLHLMLSTEQLRGHHINNSYHQKGYGLFFPIFRWISYFMSDSSSLFTYPIY